MKDFVAEDRRLEKASESTSEALMRHRWHWTLDDSNSDRVSMSEYARQIGKSLKTIQAYAKGYLLLTHGAGAVAPSEAMERAKLGAETEAAVGAVAEARGVSFQQARQSRPVEVRRVREMGRQRAEDKGTSIEDETRRAAEWLVKAEKAETNRQSERKERLGLRFVEMESYLEAARRKLIEAVNLAHEVPWGDEERELLVSTVNNVKSLLALIDLALVGAADVDWDAELAGLTEE